MIKEDYCSYEVSKLLKEKGFDWKCLAHWFIGIDRNFSISVTPQNWNEVKTDLDWLSCPTHQMAMKWLRDVYDIHISVNKIFLINDMDNKPYLVYVCTEKCNTSYNAWSEYHITYEQAVEAALEYCLTELI